MPLCYHCGKEVEYPFRCSFCNGQYCTDHRLPENHNCLNQPPRTPLGRWKVKKSTTERPPKINISHTEKAKDKRKIGILVVAVIGFLIALVLLFLYFNPTNRNSNVTFCNIPFEEDFHTSKNILQTGNLHYHFNISLATELKVEITSDEQINFKLYNYETRNTKAERKWVQIIFNSWVLKRGIWVIEIVPSDSHADGRIEVTTQKPLPPYVYVEISAIRDGSNILMNYTDDLQETISVNLTIYRLLDDEIIWNCTVNDDRKNKFSITWNKGSKFGDYVVRITANHRVFEDLHYNNMFLGELGSP